MRPQNSTSSASGHVEYRDIEGCSGYQVGDDGSVRSIRGSGGREWRFLLMGRTSGGRTSVALRTDYNQAIVKPVDRLVLEEFVGPAPEGCIAFHYPDLDFANNRLTNLHWARRNLAGRWEIVSSGSVEAGPRVEDEPGPDVDDGTCRCPHCGKRITVAVELLSAEGDV
jgi:hypothetical protein